jgi:hypothetical protein
MMGNEASDTSNVMSLVGRIEMQGKMCEVKAATPRELNGNRGFRRNNNNNINNSNTTNNEDSKALVTEGSSSNALNNKTVTTPKATPSSFVPSVYAYPPIPPNQGIPTHFPPPNAFYYPPAYPVISSATGYVPSHMEYPPTSGGFANPVSVGAYVENSFPNGVSDHTSLSQNPNSNTLGDKQQSSMPDSSLAPSKSPTPNTASIDKGVISPYPPMVHTMGYPLVPATPTLFIPPIHASSFVDGSTPIPMTAIPVLPDQLPYIPTSYGGMMPGAAPPQISPQTLHPPFHLQAASPHIFREGDMYPPPYPYYPTASAVAVGPWEPITPVPYGIVPPPTHTSSTQSEETVG